MLDISDFDPSVISRVPFRGLPLNKPLLIDAFNPHFSLFLLSFPFLFFSPFFLFLSSFLYFFLPPPLPKMGFADLVGGGFAFLEWGLAFLLCLGTICHVRPKRAMYSIGLMAFFTILVSFSICSQKADH